MGYMGILLEIIPTAMFYVLKENYIFMLLLLGFQFRGEASGLADKVFKSQGAQMRSLRE